MLSKIAGRIICAIIPFGEPEDVLKQNIDSNSIIGYDQYLLLQEAFGAERIKLYDHNEIYDHSDILIIMSTIWVFPIRRLKTFKHVIYFYDDNSVAKAESEQYAAHLAHVGLVLHPDPNEVAELRAFWSKPTYYVPWSSPFLPLESVSKTTRPSFFVDMDHRVFVRDTVESGFEFIKTMQHGGFDFYIPEKFVERAPSDCKAKIHPVPRMPHEAFLQFLQERTFYVTGIYGSYEYVTMESALLGCGLISLFSAVRQVHKDRPSCLDYAGQNKFSDSLLEAVGRLDQNKIISAARVLYPRDAVAQIPSLISQHLLKDH